MWIDDQVLEKAQEAMSIQAWVPKNSQVVLGAANKSASEVLTKNCDEDGVKVTKRYGGGGTVLLYPGCVVVSVGTWVKRAFDNDLYFEKLNQAIIESLKPLFSADASLSQGGISDLVVGQKKFCGTSLFRTRNYLLFQASIIVEKDLPLISRYLCHPSKEPDYRNGRSHEDFLMGLSDLESKLKSSDVLKQIENTFKKHCLTQLEGELIEPIQGQMKNIRARIDRAKPE